VVVLPPPNTLQRDRRGGCEDAVVTGAADDRVVPNAELTTEDQAALGWAVSTGHQLGAAVIERVRSGGSGVTTRELTAIGADWEAAGRPAPERHIHRTSVTLIDGTSVTGVTFLAGDPYGREAVPTFGLYLDERWDPPWSHAHVDWPDFGLPTDPDAFSAALRDALERAQRGERVELGCVGGHGRTGTALACLAVLAGTPAAEAVTWIRANYCPKAIETPAQESFVAAFQSGHA
jgi:Swiss Army Knife protein, DSP-PTPase phosphatase domain